MFKYIKNLFKSKPEESLKFCRDCKWASPAYGFCYNPIIKEQYGTLSLTSGGYEFSDPALNRASYLRNHFWACGIEAKYFEPKEATKGECHGELHQKPKVKSSQFCPECSTWVEI